MMRQRRDRGHGHHPIIRRDMAVQYSMRMLQKLSGAAFAFAQGLHVRPCVPFGALAFFDGAFLCVRDR
jgi:hypothetical protein